MLVIFDSFDNHNQIKNKKVEIINVEFCKLEQNNLQENYNGEAYHSENSNIPPGKTELTGEVNYDEGYD